MQPINKTFTLFIIYRRNVFTYDILSANKININVKTKKILPKRKFVFCMLSRRYKYVHGHAIQKRYNTIHGHLNEEEE